MSAGSGQWDGAWAVGDQTRVLWNLSSADTDEISQCLLDLRFISTMSGDTLHDVLGEVSLCAVTLMVAVILAASLTDPGIQTLRNHVWAWSSGDRNRGVCGRRLKD